MYKFLLTFFLFASIINSQAQESNSQIRNVGTFNKINAGKGINVTLIEGDKERVRIEIENADVTDVITDIKGRSLNIRLKTKIYKDMAVMVYVTYKSLISISAGTGAFIKSENTIHAENLELKAGTGSTIILDLNTKNLNVALSSSKVELVGKTNFQDVKSNTGGRYIADQLLSEEAYVKASTGASIWINASKKLEAKASTGGKINYIGNPEELIQSGNVQRDN